MNHPKPNVFISACIEHSPARYDGTMISSDAVKGMREFVNFITVCPEMAIGMPAPRDTIRITQQKGEEIKLVSSEEGIDYTEKMNNFTNKYVNKLKLRHIDGFILKAKSPTCGIDKIKVYKGTGKSQPLGTVQNGFFANEIVTEYPDYPIETERRLSNFNIRELFLIRIFTTARFEEIKNQPIKHLVKFHSNHKYLFMTYHQNIMRQMGTVVANHNKLPVEEVYENYYTLLQQLLKITPSKPRRINVLTHIYGYFKNLLSDSEKAYYFETQNDYLENHTPYSSPIRILRSFAIRFDQEYLLEQLIFEPYPKTLITQLDSGKKV